MPYNDYLTQNFQKHKDKEEAQTIEIEEAIAMLASSKLELESKSVASKKWKGPFEWNVEVVSLQQLIANSTAALRKAYVVRDCIHNLECGVKSATAKVKTDWHLEKAKIAAYFESNCIGLPSALAKAYAEMVYAFICPPEPLGIPRVFDVAALNFTGSEGHELFEQPKLCSRPAQQANGSSEFANRWSSGVSTRLAKIHDHVVARRQQQITKITSKVPSVMGTLELDEKMHWNGVGVEEVKILEPAVDLPTIILTRRVMTIDLHLVSNSIRGHPMHFYCHTGRLAVLILSQEAFLTNDNLIAWMKSLDVKALLELDGTLMEPGDGLFLPAGTVPIWMGLASTLDIAGPKVQLAPRGKRAQIGGGKAREAELFDEYATVVIDLMYEKNSSAALSTDLRLRLYSNYTGAKPSLRQSLRRMVSNSGLNLSRSLRGAPRSRSHPCFSTGPACPTGLRQHVSIIH